MRNNNNAIEVVNMTKEFKLAYDKPQTLKERILKINKTKYEKRTVLNDINVEIKKGETVALVGTNGSGKSTLLKLMTKILYPTKGTVETNGKLTSLLELGAGFHPDFSGRENIYFNASIFGLTKEQIDERIDRIIAFSELEEFIDNPVRTYSSGMYMRLAFSIAINVDADILLVDEILAVGDQRFQEKCFDKLCELSQSDKTIVIVSHDLATIRKICKRAIWIYQGDVREDGDVNEVIDHYLNKIGAKGDSDQGSAYIGKCAMGEPVLNDDTLIFEGYALSTCPNSSLRIYVDDKLVDEKYVERYDKRSVFVVYEDQYGSFKENPKSGFRVVNKIDTSISKHEIVVQIVDDNDQIITQESISA